jgi:hypothetical protein
MSRRNTVLRPAMLARPNQRHKTLPSRAVDYSAFSGCALAPEGFSAAAGMSSRLRRGLRVSDILTRPL